MFVFSVFKKGFKPVLHNEEFPVTEDEEKHPTIIKNGKTPDLNVRYLPSLPRRLKSSELASEKVLLS